MNESKPMLKLSKKKKAIADYMDRMAFKRDHWIKRNQFYYKELIHHLKYSIPENSKIIEIGCGTGYLLNGLNPKTGYGIDISERMINKAKENHPHLHFVKMDAEHLDIQETFDFIIISDTIGYFEDVQQAFEELHKIAHPGTRIIITYQNFFWLPFFSSAESLKLKMPSMKINWLNAKDIANILYLADLDIIKSERRFLIPKYIPVLSWLFNKYLSHLPVFNFFGLIDYVIARPMVNHPPDNELYSTSVIIPARNEKGNIENAVKRMPRLGKHTEIIYIEGNSKDATYEEIKRVAGQYQNEWDIKYAQQEGKGKGDAVRKGFSMATGDILMILDADLTVPPEDLTKFYNAIATGKGEYINGTRLVYPMEKQAMRTLNMMGNKFFSVMFSWLLGQRMKDTLCGTKVISKENWTKLSDNRHYFGDFDPFGDFDLIFGSSKLNLKLVEVPIRYHSREYGSTNISRFKHGWLLIKMMFFAMNKIKFR